ncbi:MAG TPA: cysteine desulfurase DndA [Planctomycetota bacterium]|nr:cysteine desulfurase DndA [Planctomycetota bacterium]
MKSTRPTRARSNTATRQVGPVYLDCNATTPVEPVVQEGVLRFLAEEFGNAGSRTHEYGARAKQAIERARDQVAAIVGVNREDVVFTSGATESNNLAVLGLQEHGTKTGRKHIVSTQIEHKAILEPLSHLATRGFDITLVPPAASGIVDPDAVRAALREDTLLVSVMHVNNETGVIQPISDIARHLEGHHAYFHVDAAQSFGKGIPGLEIPRIDMLSASAHKIFGPKGVGALIVRRRGFDRLPLQPLFFGGGQERGLRPGTLPVPLIVGFGIASELAQRDTQKRLDVCRSRKHAALRALSVLDPAFNGDPDRAVAHTINVSFPGVDSEAVLLALKDLVAISNGSACTSHSYAPSHVLKAMQLPTERIASAVRLSWCHLTPEPDWTAIVQAIARLR